MRARSNWLALGGSILIVGSVPFSLLAVKLWSRWEVHAAPQVAATVLENFSPPCHAVGVQLRCDVQVTAMPQGPYSFEAIDTMPFEGVYVVVRYSDGRQVDLDIFPSIWGQPRVNVVQVTQ
jgi:hypothetical protein